jgi:hypothetical protein
LGTVGALSVTWCSPTGDGVWRERSCEKDRESS